MTSLFSCLLQLHNIDAVPREVMKEILKELCRITEVTDVATLATEIEKMNKVITVAVVGAH